MRLNSHSTYRQKSGYYFVLCFERSFGYFSKDQLWCWSRINFEIWKKYFLKRTQKLNPAGHIVKWRCRIRLKCRVCFSFWVIRWNNFLQILHCWVNFSDMTGRSRLSIGYSYWTRFNSFTGQSCCRNCLSLWRGASNNYFLNTGHMNQKFRCIIFCIVEKSSFCPVSRCSICIRLTTFPLPQESVSQFLLKGGYIAQSKNLKIHWWSYLVE